MPDHYRLLLKSAAKSPSAGRAAAEHFLTVQGTDTRDLLRRLQRNPQYYQPLHHPSPRTIMLQLPITTYSALVREGIITDAQLAQLDDTALAALRLVGPDGITAIRRHIPEPVR